MQKPVVGFFGCAICALLAACTPGGASAGDTGNVPAPRAGETATPTPSEASLDGVWVIRLEDPTSSCVTVHDRLLHISGGIATVSTDVAGLEDSGPNLSGPATMAAGAVDLHLENAAPTKDSLDFSGKVSNDGTVPGTAQAGGIHPGLTNGYTCDFAATLLPVAAPTSAECTTAEVQAALNTAPERTRFVTLKNQATQLVCSGDWALAFPQVELSTGTPTLESDLLRVQNGAWEVRDFAAECTSREAPEELLFACP